MLRASIDHLRRRSEIILAVVSFGASSVYWLGLALLMDAVDYGKMMTLQAAVLLVGAIVTLRTHDLVFHLISQHRLNIQSAFRHALKWELATAVLTLVISTAGAMVYFSSAESNGVVFGVAAFAFATAIGSSSGGSIAKLRHAGRGDVIAVADMLCVGAWTISCAMMLSPKLPSTIALLVIGALPNFVRTLSLMVAAARLTSPVCDDETAAVAKRWDVTVFLMGGQVANGFKNAIVPIETMILAAFASPVSVAMYRLARALQGPANAAMNVSYQRNYPILARPSPPEKRTQTLRRMRRNALLICAAFYPVAAAGALAYSWVKPEFAIIEFQLLALGTFVASLPAAYQQASFAILSVEGDHKAVGMAYSLSILCLLATLAVLSIIPSLVIFMMGIVVAALIRSWYLDRAARRVVHTGLTLQNRQGATSPEDLPNSLNLGS